MHPTTEAYPGLDITYWASGRTVVTSRSTGEAVTIQYIRNEGDRPPGTRLYAIRTVDEYFTTLYPDALSRAGEILHAHRVLPLNDALSRTGKALYGERWQSALASDLGVSDRTIRRYITGDRSPPPEIYVGLIRLCRERARVFDTLVGDMRKVKYSGWGALSLNTETSPSPRTGPPPPGATAPRPGAWRLAESTETERTQTMTYANDFNDDGIGRQVLTPLAARDRMPVEGE